MQFEPLGYPLVLWMISDKFVARYYIKASKEIEQRCCKCTHKHTEEKKQEKSLDAHKNNTTSSKEALSHTSCEAARAIVMKP